MVEELKKKEDELVVKKITTSRAYQQNAELARQTGLAAMGMMTGNVTQAPTVPGAPPVTPIATSGGSASASKSSDARSQSKAQYSVDGMMSAAFNQMGILKQEADKIISTFKQQEEAKQKYIDGVKKQTEAEQKRLELTKLYGDNMSEIDTQMQLYNATREYGIQIGSEEYRQLEEQIRARKQAADSVKELEKAKANEVEQAKKAAESQKQWNNQLTYAFKDAIMNSKNLGDALSNLANRVQDMLVNNALDSLLGGMFASMKFAKGAAFQAGGVTAFASGGVVNSPTMFPMRGGVGLMGEAGAEAIMPLTRTSNGDLGVKAVGAGTVVNTSININVSGGTKEQNEDAGKRVSAAVRQAIDDTVVSVIMREKRPGGVLNAA
jgi:phage-related minor tail protein